MHRELIDGDDAVRPQQVGQHGGGGICIGQCVVWPGEIHPVALAQIGEPVRVLSLRVEATRQTQRAEHLADRQFDASAFSRLVQEGDIELGVVSYESRAVEPVGKFGEYIASGGCSAQVSSVDTVQTGGADAVPPAKPWREQAGVAVEHGALAVDDDDSYLQDVVALQRQPGRLDIDDGEALGADRLGHVGRHIL